MTFCQACGFTTGRSNIRLGAVALKTLGFQLSSGFMFNALAQLWMLWTPTPREKGLSPFANGKGDKTWINDKH